MTSNNSNPHQTTREFNAELEARTEVRTRVARPLHDTQLPRFRVLLLRFQAAYNLLLGRAIAKAHDEAQDLRSPAVAPNDLVNAVESLAEELAARQTAADGDAAGFWVTVEGAPRELDPSRQVEIYRIAGEALRNAFRHARARRIEIEVRYDTRQLRVRVRDNGIGIDAGLLSQEGRGGRWGLRGMHERANRLGGRLEFWSKAGVGTEVELTVPASFAYGTPASSALHAISIVRRDGRELSAGSSTEIDFRSSTFRQVSKCPEELWMRHG
ncbi:MAG TPA: ATP-binding protein [Bryobacteraceae bacterium]|nr:ATP-binding protein [Bryobacteraceae bacterium]